jgi:DNA-binding CsgD family transcriptional regulator/tetratricopeptide (TPR) repeat protein
MVLSAPAGTSHPPGQLLERDRERSSLTACLDTVVRGSAGRLVLVSGDAGIGKSALLRQFRADVGDRTRVLWGSCDPLFTPRPLGPLLAVAEDAGGELEEVVTRGVMPHEVAAALGRELRARGPSVFVLEDVHWADEATLDALRLLVRRIETIPAVVVASYRHDGVDRKHPLRAVLGEFATSPSVDRIKLGALSPAAVARLAQPHGVDAQQLWDRTAGNPFFVAEALAAPEQGVPDTVREAVLARASRLGESGRSVLDAVSVVPQRAELWLVAALVDEAVDGVDECLSSGMLASEPGGVAFRHELARLAVEDAVPLMRRIALHRRAVAALSDPGAGAPDVTRLAHHADAAGDAEAVLRFAPAAATRAATLCAHREAAAQYARALRFGDGLAPEPRAELLESRAWSCFITDQYDEAIAAVEEALELRRALGHRLEEADDLCRLSGLLWCPGRSAEALRAAQDSVDLFDAVGPDGPELARACANLAFVYRARSQAADALALARRAVALAEPAGDEETVTWAMCTIADFDAYEIVDQALARARKAGLDEAIGYTTATGAAIALDRHRYADAARHLAAGLAHCSARGLELYRLYLLGFQARFELDQGRLTEAADTAATVLRIPRTSTTPRIWALTVLGLVRARRGDPGAHSALEDAWELARMTDELPRLGLVAAARAEAAWLEGDNDAVDEATRATLSLAVELDSPWAGGELAVWRRRSGLPVAIPARAEELRALELRGDHERAAHRWHELGCSYDAALTLTAATPDAAPGEGPARRALEDLQQLGAWQAAAVVARRLRLRGARGLPRGPRPATSANPAHLTTRQREVLELVADGAGNAEIARRLVLSERTVAHHVTAILRKLDVRNRGEAGAVAVRLGLSRPT